MNKQHSHKRSYLFILLSLIIAVLLSLLPLPKFAIWLMPFWFVLCVIYWAMALPHRMTIGTAWLLGFFIDVMNGSLLGKHALGLALVAFIIHKFHARIRNFPLAQQSLVILAVLLLYQAILFWIQGISGKPYTTWLIWIAPVSSMLIWPWIFSVLRSYRRNFRVV